MQTVPKLIGGEGRVARARGRHPEPRHRGGRALPLVGALFNLVAFAYGLAKQAHQVSVVAGVLVALCFVSAIAARFMSRAPYFSRGQCARPRGAAPGRAGTRRVASR